MKGSRRQLSPDESQSPNLNKRDINELVLIKNSNLVSGKEALADIDTMSDIHRMLYGKVHISDLYH